jgi:4-amino-4-deoxy-L-arabinose transferase-like glycosyltransferase
VELTRNLITASYQAALAEYMDIRAWRYHRRGFVWLTAAVLSAAMFFLLLGSSWEDSLTWDEHPHITAGYTYLRLRDARLNSEHPPLLKMLAAVPLLSLPLNFPLAHPAWQADVRQKGQRGRQQWTMANAFLYESGNDSHCIAVWARIAPILLTVLLGLLLFLWARRFAGDGTALLTLLLYTLSPTVLAHGRYVTTDVPASLGVALAGFSFIQFLAAPSRKTALVSGLALGTALLFKFSTVLLVPLLVTLTLLWSGLEPQRVVRYLTGLVIMGLSTTLFVLLPYLWTTAQYPPERQLQDTYFTLPPFSKDENTYAALVQDRTRDLRACAHSLRPVKRCLADLMIFLADKPILRAWEAYLLGLVKVALHMYGRHISPTYFLGDVSFTAWWYYFPVVYAIKEPLPLHILTAFALFLALARVWSGTWGVRSLLGWLRGHSAETLMLSWLILYWGGAMRANLNIGVRHLLPVYPFTLILVARELCQWLKGVQQPFAMAGISPRVKWVVLALLLTWQCVSVLRVYPAFLAYFNEAVGGPEGGANYVVDSNLDWGQDLRRLRAFVEAHRIEKIAVDYFGWASGRDALGERFISWRSALGPYQGWLAVSASILKRAQGRWDSTVKYQPDAAYEWLQGRAPVATIGYSIFVFDLRDIRVRGSHASDSWEY